MTTLNRVKGFVAFNSCYIWQDGKLSRHMVYSEYFSNWDNLFIRLKGKKVLVNVLPKTDRILEAIYKLTGGLVRQYADRRVRVVLIEKGYQLITEFNNAGCFYHGETPLNHFSAPIQFKLMTSEAFVGGQTLNEGIQNAK